MISDERRWLYNPKLKGDSLEQEVIQRSTNILLRKNDTSLSLCTQGLTAFITAANSELALVFILQHTDIPPLKNEKIGKE